MTTLEPRRVDSAAPRRWLRSAWQLMRRRPLDYAAGTVLSTVIFVLLLGRENGPTLWLFALLAPPLTLGGFMRLARSADTGRVFRWRELLPSNREALHSVLLAAAGYSVVFAPLALLTLGFDPALTGGEETVSIAPPAGSTLGLLLLPGLSLLAYSGLLLGMGAWFVLPISALIGGRVGHAALLSWRACRINAPSLRFTGFGAMLGVTLGVLLTFGAASALLAPLFGSVLYVSFRDVFLGRAENAPEVAAARTGSLSSTSADALSS